MDILQDIVKLAPSLDLLVATDNLNYSKVTIIVSRMPASAASFTTSANSPVLSHSLADLLDLADESSL